MESAAFPITPKEWCKTLRADKIPVLEMSIRRPSFQNSGKTARIERYFEHLSTQWKTRWETVLYPDACRSLAAAAECGSAFTPWQTRLSYEVTCWDPPILSLRIETVEIGRAPQPFRIHQGETWDCGTGYPRTLRSFFPAGNRRWRRDLLSEIRAQAEDRLRSGESLLDPDCLRIMERSFDPERFYLTEQGIAIFYPLYVLGPCAEGIPTFLAACPEAQANGCPSLSSTDTR